MNAYKIIATYEESGNQCWCDRNYAMGNLADTAWRTREDAEDAADELREDVGTVVDARVEYEVVEFELTADYHICEA